jgi:maleylacetate reductase
MAVSVDRHPRSRPLRRGICSGEANPYGDAQALHGLSLLAYGLPRVKADPGDRAARLDCQTGSWLSMAPLASGVPMGASHGIGYVLGTLFDIPHGHTSCIVLPAVMRWNKPANAERQALVAAAMGHPGEDASDVLDAFIAGLSMPRSLDAVNIRAENFDRLAEPGDGHAVGAAQPAADRGPCSDPRNPRTSGVRPARVSPALQPSRSSDSCTLETPWCVEP